MAQAAHARAQQQIAAGHFGEATAEMETAVRYEPRFALGWYMLASAARRSSRWDQALFAYRRYMQLRPGEPDPFFGAGLCLTAIGDNAAAATALRQYIALDVRPASREFVQVARKQLAELERAATDAAKAPAPAAAPELAAARQERDRGHVDEAVAKYRAAMRASPSEGEAAAELGALLLTARRQKEAAEVLRAAVRLNPRAPSAWYNLAFALRESGQAEEAVASYRRYISFRPQDPDPHYGLGRALLGLNRPDEALGAFRTYATLETRSTERQWVKKARGEIARLEAAQRARLSGGAVPPAPPPSSGGDEAAAPYPMPAPYPMGAHVGARPSPSAPGEPTPAPVTTDLRPPASGASPIGPPSGSATSIQPPPTSQPR